MSLFISQNVYDQITTHLQAAYPNEGAGLILGRADGSRKIASAILPFVNKSESGEQYHRYLITETNRVNCVHSSTCFWQMRTCAF